MNLEVHTVTGRKEGKRETERKENRQWTLMLFRNSASLQPTQGYKVSVPHATGDPVPAESRAKPR